MRRLLAAILALTLLAPAPAFALRPRAGRELPATTTLLETGLEERVAAPPATRPKAPNHDAPIGAWTLLRMSQARVNTQARIHRILQHPEAYALQSESTVPLPENLVKGPGGTWYLHLHVVHRRSQRSLNGVLVRLSTGQDGLLVAEEPWLERAPVDILPMFFSVGDIAPNALRWFMEAATNAIQPQQDDLRRAMAEAPTMVLGITASPGAQGYLVMKDLAELSEGDTSWFYDRRLMLTARRLDLATAAVIPGPNAVTATPKEEALAILRYWGHTFWRPHQGISGVGAHYVQVFTKTALAGHPWLTTFLQAFPQEMDGHLAVLGDTATRAPFANIPGLVTAETPRALLSLLQLWPCQRPLEPIFYSDNREDPDVAAFRALNNNLSLLTRQIPLEDLDHADFRPFAERLYIAALHADPPQRWLSEPKRWYFDDVEWLAARLEQWLAQPGAGDRAGLEERTADPEARLRTRVAQQMSDSRRQVTEDLSGDLSECTVASEAIVALPDNLVQGPGIPGHPPALYLHLHLFGPGPEPEMRNGLLFRLTHDDGTLTLDDPWAEELTGSPFFQVSDLAPAAVAPLLAKARAAIEPYRADLLEAMQGTPTMVLGVSMTPGGIGHRLILNRPPFDTKERWVHDYSTSLTALRMDLQPSFLLPGEVRLSAAEDARAVLRMWAESWQSQHRDDRTIRALPPADNPDGAHRVQVLTASALAHAPWLLPLLNTWPQEFRGHVAILGDARVRSTLSHPAGLVVEESSGALVAELEHQRHGCPAGHTVLVVYSDDAQEVRWLRGAIEDNPGWRLVHYPASRLSRSHLRDFAAQVYAAMVHASAVRSQTAEQKVEVLYLADRLEQWL